MSIVDPRRVRILGNTPPAAGPVVYWMNRDQRVRDNWALLHAQELARERQVPLGVVFTLPPPGNVDHRHVRFMLDGLAQTAADLAAKGVPFFLFEGDPVVALLRFAKAQKAGLIVTDFSPLRGPRQWREAVAEVLPLIEVDAQNIVPCWVASPKQEFAAYTFRPKINRLLPEFLQPFPAFKKEARPWPGRAPAAIDWGALRRRWCPGAGEYEWIEPGEKAALSRLDEFAAHRLARYGDRRNDPNLNATSRLSPYFKFGQLSPQRVALAASGAPNSESRVSFLEELVVRRELSDNFCFYNPRYDQVAGFAPWAQKTLGEHRADPRLMLYPTAALEAGETGDPLWNAAQRVLVREGRMHGWLRMYWAKRLLEWTESPEAALALGIDFNDRFALDGTTPNGYVGVAWSVGGVHDRAWGERPIFGKIRFMNLAGAKRKFDVNLFVARVDPRLTGSPSTDKFGRR